MTFNIDDIIEDSRFIKMFKMQCENSENYLRHREPANVADIISNFDMNHEGYSIAIQLLQYYLKKVKKKDYELKDFKLMSYIRFIRAIRTKLYPYYKVKQKKRKFVGLYGLRKASFIDDFLLYSIKKNPIRTRSFDSISTTIILDIQCLKEQLGK